MMSNLAGSLFTAFVWLASIHSAQAQEKWLMPAKGKTLISYQSSQGLPEKQGWEKLAGGENPGSVDARIESSALLLDDSSSKNDYLSYQKQIPGDEHPEMATSGWILELDLTVEGSEILLDDEDESAETCSIHLLDKNGQILHRLPIHLDPDTDGQPGDHSWRVGPIQHSLKTGDTIRLEFKPDEQSLILRVGGDTRNVVNDVAKDFLPHAIAWGSFPSSGTSTVTWREVSLSIADWKKVRSEEERAQSILTQQKVNDLSGLDFSKPFQGNMEYPPYTQKKFTDARIKEVPLTISLPDIYLSDKQDVTCTFLLGTKENVSKNHATLNLYYNKDGQLRTVNLFAESQGEVWSRNEKNISQINAKDSESGADLIKRALSEYQRRAARSPSPKTNEAIVAAVELLVPLYHKEFEEFYFAR